MAELTGYCFVSISPVRKEQADSSEMVTQLLFGEPVKIMDVQSPWMNVKSLSDGYEGWVDLKHIKTLSQEDTITWQGEKQCLLAREAVLETPQGKQVICRGSYISDNSVFQIGVNHYRIDPGQTSYSSLIDLAKEYMNTPYLWGGKTPYGIDCSGFTQIVHRCFRIELPRDASQQYEFGSEVSFEDAREGDLAFFENKTGKITHVGILLDNERIIHASGQVRIDELKKEGIYRSDFKRITHLMAGIRRL